MNIYDLTELLRLPKLKKSSYLFRFHIKLAEAIELLAIFYFINKIENAVVVGHPLFAPRVMTFASVEALVSPADIFGQFKCLEEIQFE